MSASEAELESQILHVLKNLSGNLDEHAWNSYYLDVTNNFRGVLRGDDLADLVRTVARLDQRGNIVFDEAKWVDNNIYVLGIVRPNLYYLKINRNSFSRSLDLFIRIRYIFPNKYELIGARITHRG